ncbi:hypothetical protein Vretimale_16176 [Volvox reticuliferus]|uniref:Calcineurin-like phosphoesterase domain-containing protein n=1 Tax=Volvox reticuliferus TaxID=1737510 RepID=A0A8J4GSG5_9CHLO|nr:hypothetical protein Vretimale_16176 [Volvox reticuliferus]
MQFLRGSLPWHLRAPNAHANCEAHSKTGASSPRTAPRRFISWAMSALGFHPSTMPRQPAAIAADAAASTPPTAAINPSGRLRLAIVGDVHGAWIVDRDEAALRLLAPDLTLLVGDFGNEDVALVREVAKLGLPKAVILGNHDAWFSLTGRAGSQASRGGVQQTRSAGDMLAALLRGGGAEAAAGLPPSPDPVDYVSEQLAALGTSHVGYGTMPLDEQGYTVMGARPFSKGGRSFSSIRGFMEGLYGVTSMEESAQRIVQVAESAPVHHALIVMGHNGPAGLGSRAFDICGVDWEPKAGDHGDPDLQAALAALHRAGRRVSLVTFGHMHHRLYAANSRGRSSRLRRMVALDPATGTVFLNAATVPRINPASFAASEAALLPPPPHNPSTSSAPLTSPKRYGSGKRARIAAAASVTATTTTSGSVARGAAHHHFMIADLDRGEVVSVRDVWVQVTPVTEETVAAVLQAATSGEAAEAESAGSNTDSGEDESNEKAPAIVMEPRRIGNYVVQIVRQHVVLRTVPGENGAVVKFIWNAHDQVYEPYVLGSGAAPTAAASDASNSEGQAAVAGGKAQPPGDDSEMGTAPTAATAEATAAAASEPVAAATVLGLTAR